MDAWKFDPDVVAKCLDHEASVADVGMLRDCAANHDDVIANLVVHAAECGREAENMLDYYSKLHRLALRSLSMHADVRRRK